MSVKELEKKFKAARKAWRADKEDAKLKKAFKAAKKAFEAAGGSTPSKKRKAEDDAETPKKKAKEEPKEEKAEAGADLSALEKALKKARKAKKADASPANKKAFKAAKKALEEAKAAAEKSGESKEDAEEAEAEAEAEAEPEKPSGLAGLSSGLDGLTQGGNAAANNAGGNKGGWKSDENPPNVKVFVANLDYNVDDDSTREFFKDCGSLTDIFWLTHRDTGNFKGCGFLTFESLEASAAAVAKEGQEFMGREIRVSYAAPKKGGKGGKGGKGRPDKPLGPKPEGCTTCFVGGVSDEATDESMTEFAASAGCGDVKSIRWITDRDTGNFKGCGFIEFYDTADVDKFVKKKGEEFLGRTLRVDYAEGRKKW